MKNLIFPSLLAACIISLNSCQVIEGIFKAGVWSGVIIVVLVVALVIYVISRLAGKK